MADSDGDQGFNESDNHTLRELVCQACRRTNWIATASEQQRSEQRCCRRLRGLGAAEYSGRSGAVALEHRVQLAPEQLRCIGKPSRCCMSLWLELPVTVSGANLLGHDAVKVPLNLIDAFLSTTDSEHALKVEFPWLRGTFAILWES